MEKQILSDTQLVEPHTYPLWIKYSVAIVIFSTLYAFSLLPKYLIAAKKIHDAKASYQVGKYAETVQLYQSVLSAIPTSKVACLGAAEAIFSQFDRNEDQIGLNLLQGINLSKDEWARIKEVMPIEYQQYFQETKQ